jgi:hypothetical protein
VEVHLFMISGRLSDEPLLAMSAEKCTMPQPRAAANPQIPIIAIAVNKRMSHRQILREEKKSNFVLVRAPAGGSHLIRERQSRTLGLS